MKWIFPLSLVTLLLCPFSYAYEVLDLNKHPDLKRSLSIVAYDQIEVLNFDDWRKLGHSAETTSVRLKKYESEYTAGIYAFLTMGSDGKKQIHFSTQCSVETDMNPAYVLRVEEVNIKAATGCMKNHAGNLARITFALTDTGRELILEKFRKNKVVNVSLENMVIPFSAIGFSAAFDRLGEAPL